jgi:glycosyltransferase involved in cell wall biosynthesis
MVRTFNIGLLMHASSSWMGGVVYVQNLIKAIASLPKEKRLEINLYLLVTSETAEHFYESLLPLVDGYYKADFLSQKFLSKIRRRGSQLFPALQKYLISSLQITPIGKTIDFFYPVVGEREIFWEFSARWAAWIPDFQHKYLPEFFSKTEISRRDALFSRMANQSTHIVFSSQTSLNDFRNFYPNAYAQPQVLRFHTTLEEAWFSVKPEAIQKKYNLPESFFLVSNQFWKHKNHKVLVKALHILQKNSLKPIIVCTGELYDDRFPGYAQELLSLIDRYNIRQQFYFLGLIPRIEQIQLMRCSLAVIQPSLFEGWSTVVEDARALGKKIILSDIPVHIEQNPPQSIYFSPHSSEDLAHKILTLLPTLKTVAEKLSEDQITQQQILSQSYAENFLQIAIQVSQ